MYKILITKLSNRWAAVLKKRHWFFGWRSQDAIITDLPYSDKVIEWQKEFNIPDGKVIIV